MTARKFLVERRDRSILATTTPFVYTGRGREEKVDGKKRLARLASRVRYRVEQGSERSRFVGM